MRRPTVPAASDPVGRRLRDSIRDLIAWFDAGTRTQELVELDTVGSYDLAEFVKPDGTRYATRAFNITTGAGITVGHGAPATPGHPGQLYIDLDTGDLYSWS